MAKSKSNPQARAALDKFKYEVANEIGVNLKQGYNGDLTSKQAGSVGGEMVKKLVAKAANDKIPDPSAINLCFSTSNKKASINS